MRRANHPPSCPACHGCGYEDGPDEWETIGGQPHRYTTVQPCTHHWTDDPPTLMPRLVADVPGPDTWNPQQ